jgi:phage shock protein PspC (stress-responsive transcriptional regulator)
MTNTPPDAPSGSTEPSDPPGPPSSWIDPEPPPSGGPRVTREEAKDLGRIRRSRTDRKIAGVAGGIARHFDVDPLLVRVGLVLLAIFGGGGVLVYAAGWLLIPEEGSDEGVIKVEHRTRTVLLTIVGAIAALSLVGDSIGGWDFPWPLAVILLVVAAIAAASRPKPHPGPLPSNGWIPPGTPGEVPDARTGFGSTYPGYQPGPKPQPVDTRRRGPILFWFTAGLAMVGLILVATFDLAGWDAPISAYPAVVLLVCGVMLLVGAFYGRGGGLIFVGLIAALATLAATAVQDISAGQIDTTPQKAADVKDRYELGVGEIIIDLRDLSPTELDELDERTVEADVRLGHIRVLVPDDGLDVTANSNIEGAGESVLFENRTDGSDKTTYGDDDAAPNLTLDLEVLFGQIEVLTEEPA